MEVLAEIATIGIILRSSWIVLGVLFVGIAFVCLESMGGGGGAPHVENSKP